MMSIPLRPRACILHNDAADPVNYEIRDGRAVSL
jgi:hypothetical protein